MSTFQELSQAVGIAIHKASNNKCIQERKYISFLYDSKEEQMAYMIAQDQDVISAIQKLVEHTIQNTGDNE